MLRSITLGVTLLLFNTGLLNAQTLSIGPTVGMNVSNITNVANSKSLNGLSIGGFANYSINEHVGLGAKLIFSQLGTSFTNSNQIVRLNYLQLPITATYYFGATGNMIRPKIYAGPYIGALLNAKNENGDKIIGPAGQELYSKSDFGGAIGIGLNYILKSRTWLNVDAGYIKSFKNITTSSTGSNFNSAFNVNVGISFPVSGQ